MKNINILLLLSLSFLFGQYVVGDQMSIDHQNMEFEYCYPADSSGSTYIFSEHNGDLNGGNYKVFMLERSAAW